MHFLIASNMNFLNESCNYVNIICLLILFFFIKLVPTLFNYCRLPTVTYYSYITILNNLK